MALAASDSLEWKPGRSVSLAITGPLESDKWVVLGHGVSFDMNEDTIVAAANAAAEVGWTSVRFNFPYREEGHAFDRIVHVPEAEAAMLAVVKEYVFPERGRGTSDSRKQLVLGGKSFGARIAVQIRSCVERVSGFCFLGYPVRPPNQHKMSHGLMADALDSLMEDRLKDLLRLGRPALFVEGTADPFMPSEALARIERDSLPPATVARIEGGDHSFKVGEEENAEGRARTVAAIHAAVREFMGKM